MRRREVCGRADFSRTEATYLARNEGYAAWICNRSGVRAVTTRSCKLRRRASRILVVDVELVGAQRLRQRRR